MLIAFSITPLGVGESVGDLVAEAVRVVRESGLPNIRPGVTDAMTAKVAHVEARLAEAENGPPPPAHRPPTSRPGPPPTAIRSPYGQSDERWRYGWHSRRRRRSA
ncbi:hypothetical protein ABZ807_20665 [Micromonospora sp. NPDC047548]|uniref:hypothetical protein n=1 Tax=Micromonospora sp. NPDC047548 TaxID=3155624 RepID=UPI0033F868A4